MLLVVKHEANSLRSKPLLGESGFCKGFLFLDGESLPVWYDHLGSLSIAEKGPIFSPAKFVLTPAIFLSLRKGNEPPNCEYSTGRLTHPRCCLQDPKQAYFGMHEQQLRWLGQGLLLGIALFRIVRVTYVEC